MAFYNWDELEAELITPEYSTAFGSTIHGEKVEIGRFPFPAGTQAKTHAHPNEQFLVVMKGKGKWTIGGEEKALGPGEVAYCPPNVEHGLQVLDEDLEVFNIKTSVEGWSVKHAKWES